MSRRPGVPEGASRPRSRAWSPEEQAVVERHARASGEPGGPSVREAARACRDELAGLPGRRERTEMAVYDRLLSIRRSLGLRLTLQRWSPEEQAVVERHARASGEPGGPFVHEAATACVEELAGLPGARERTEAAVRERLNSTRRRLELAAMPRAWSPEEQAVVERYARDIGTEGGPSVREAARACRDELSRLPGGSERTEMAVYDRLLSIRRSLGLRLTVQRWSPEEQAVVERHARAIGTEGGPGYNEAVRACTAELARLPGGSERTEVVVYDRLLSIRRSLGLRLTVQRWSPEELAVVERHARAIGTEGGPGYNEAVRACTAELARLPGARGRSPVGILSRLTSARCRLGLVRSQRGWQPEELAVVERHARAIGTEGGPGYDEAVRACTAELARLPGGRGRTPASVLRCLTSARCRLGLARPNKGWRPEELAVLERHARAVGTEGGPGHGEAVRACRDELSRLPGARERTEIAVRERLQSVRRRLGLRLTPRAWSPEELAVVERHARATGEPDGPMVREAATACRDELARLPTRPGRSVDVVKQRLAEARRRLGLPLVQGGWSRRELAVAERHARALAAGRHPSMHAAVRACVAELARGDGPSRTSDAAYYQLWRFSGGRRGGQPRQRGVGDPVLPRKPTRVEEENVVFAEWARSALDGRCSSPTEALAQCRRELADLDARRARDGGEVETRSEGADQRRFYRWLARLGSPPRPRLGWTPEDRAVVERAVDRYLASLLSVRPLRLGAVTGDVRRELTRRGRGREATACYEHIKDALRRRQAADPDGVPTRQWRPREWKLLEKAVCGFAAEEQGGRILPRTPAILRLRGALKQVGPERTLEACIVEFERALVKEERARPRGGAKAPFSAVTLLTRRAAEAVAGDCLLARESDRPLDLYSAGLLLRSKLAGKGRRHSLKECGRLLREALAARRKAGAGKS